MYDLPYTVHGLAIQYHPSPMCDCPQCRWWFYGHPYPFGPYGYVSWRPSPFARSRTLDATPLTERAPSDTNNFFTNPRRLLLLILLIIVIFWFIGGVRF